MSSHGLQTLCNCLETPTDKKSLCNQSSTRGGVKDAYASANSFPNQSTFSVCLSSKRQTCALWSRVYSLQSNERGERVTENWWPSERPLNGTNLCSYFVRKLSLQKYFFHWDSLSLCKTLSISPHIHNENVFHNVKCEIHMVAEENA